MVRKNEEILVPEVSQVPWRRHQHWEFTSQGIGAEWEPSDGGERGKCVREIPEIPPCCSSLPCTAPGKHLAPEWGENFLSGDTKLCLRDGQSAFSLSGGRSKALELQSCSQSKSRRSELGKQNVYNTKQPGKCEASP